MSLPRLSNHFSPIGFRGGYAPLGLKSALFRSIEVPAEAEERSSDQFWSGSIGRRKDGS